jgi:hypothetical protein
MSDESNWLKNPILPRPPAVPYFNAQELEELPDSDRRLIVRTYARETLRRSRRISGAQVTPLALESSAPLRRAG